MKKTRLFSILSLAFSCAIPVLAQRNSVGSPEKTLIQNTCPDTTKCEVRRARAGIIVLDKGPQTRAFEPFGGTTAGAASYADMVNRYKEAFGDSVTVYCMTIPNAVAFYCPEEQQAWTKNEKNVLAKLYEGLEKSIVPVKIYDELSAHKDEPIYSRTDHHWAPLGAYYAAKCFAEAANVRFMPLSSYEKRTVKNYVGSMYTFSKDISVKNAPEDFVYYVPQNVSYTTWFTNYTLSKGKTVGESSPVERNFFISYRDGSSGAYCTFMGGDSRTVKVVTENKNGRRLMILKDSYGNALPAYLFYGYEEIHVVDFRYFPHSIRNYVKENSITDVLFANNLIHACSPATSRKYLEMLAR